MAQIELRNETDLEFKDISSEKSRSYYFPGGGIVTIHSPQWLHVSRSGGHRVLDGYGNSHYVAKGWMEIVWAPKEDGPHFVT